MRLVVLALAFCAVAAYVPSLAASQLSASRVAPAASPMLPAAAPADRAAVMMSGNKEGPPDTEMFDPIYLAIACLPWVALLVTNPFAG